MTHVSQAQVAMDQPSRYLSQLCKHFEHRLQVTYEGAQGSIVFPTGTCSLQAEVGALTMRIETADADELPKLQDVVGRHLLRFAFRSPPEMVWAKP